MRPAVASTGCGRIVNSIPSHEQVGSPSRSLLLPSAPWYGRPWSRDRRITRCHPGKGWRSHRSALSQSRSLTMPDRVSVATVPASVIGAVPRPARMTSTSAPLQAPRHGEPFEVNRRELALSFFPTHRDGSEWQLADTIFAVNPWAVMRGVVEEAPARDRAEARAFLEQSQDFFVTASERLAANPLLYYYSFLNLGKSLLRLRGIAQSLDHAHHGLTEPPPPPGRRPPPIGRAHLSVRARGQRVNVFPALVRELGYPWLRNGLRLPISALLAQVVVGHRQWQNATGGSERFFAVSQISVKHRPDRQRLWTCIYVADDDYSRYGLSASRVLREGRLSKAYNLVASDVLGFTCFELRSPVPYAHNPLEALDGLANSVRQHLWRIVSAQPGESYRRYYVYTSPTRQVRVPQIASLWAILFYLGSIVRYRPHVFDRLIAGRYGPFISEFVTAQPDQLLYMLASEMCRREVAKPAIA